jgi:hypothetical protein
MEVYGVKIGHKKFVIEVGLALSGNVEPKDSTEDFEQVFGDVIQVLVVGF